MKKIRMLWFLLLFAGCCAAGLVREYKKAEAGNVDILEESLSYEEKTPSDIHGFQEFAARYLKVGQKRENRVKVAVLETQEVENGDSYQRGKMLRQLICEQTAGGNVEVILIRVQRERDEPVSESLARAIDDAVGQGVNIILLPFVGEDSSYVLQQSMIKAFKSSCFLVAAAGDFGTDTQEVMPGNMACVFVAGACNRDGESSSYANTGDEISVAAFDEYVYGGETYRESSISAAYVSSAAALILSAFPQTSPEELGNHIRNHAKDVDDPAYDIRTGFGMLSLQDFQVENKESQPIRVWTGGYDGNGDAIVQLGTSTYYSEAKGWTFNDIVYMDSCPRYTSSSGGYSPGLLEEGWYRFVKSNGSYVALCTVELETGTKARAAFKAMWDHYGGMWKWEQALYNQIDGTPEGSVPTAIKRAILDTGVVVQDEAQNYRFTKCWIKIQDLKPNPETQAPATFKQTLRYYFINPRTGAVTEDVSRREECMVEEGQEYSFSVSKIQGHTIQGVSINGADSKNLEKVAVTIKGENEFLLYYTPNKMYISFDGNGATGNMDELLLYYGETGKLPPNAFYNEGATFIGWAEKEGDREISYPDQSEVKNLESGNNIRKILFAVWDYAPKLYLKEGYFTQEELLQQKDMRKYILSFSKASDREDGEIIPGKGEKTYFQIISEIENQVAAKKEGWIEYVVRAGDSAGNEVEALSRMYLVDAAPRQMSITPEDMRFIKKEFLNTLKEDSVWRIRQDYKILLRNAFTNPPQESWVRTKKGWRKW